MAEMENSHIFINKMSVKINSNFKYYIFKIIIELKFDI